MVWVQTGGPGMMGGLTREPMLEWQQSASPVLVLGSSAVDVVHAACTSRNAALVTRIGELYTWGFGNSKRLPAAKDTAGQLSWLGRTTPLMRPSPPHHVPSL